MVPCTDLRCGRGVGIRSAVRRTNRNLCVCRSAFLEPIGKDQDAFYEQRLLLGLPWHCPKRPASSRREGRRVVSWTFTTSAPSTPSHLQSFTVTDGILNDNTTYDQLCVQYERAHIDFACECCIDLAATGVAGTHEPGPCDTCLHATGWHRCECYQKEGVWRAGTLHAGNLDAASSLWALARRLVPLDALRSKVDAHIEAG